MFILIAAIGENRGIGHNGDLIFHIKDDMDFFKDTTSGHTVVMGRRTWESLPGKLKNRKNLVVTHQNLEGPDEIIQNVDDFIAQHKDTTEEIFIIGGASVYEKFLPYAKTLYLTEISAPCPNADTFFPAFDKNKYTKKIIKKGSENGLDYSIIKYIKN
ncbi:dihydrofolate reductase [Candidatus Saccharibacteria bacterium]|nr:dihydrofolate reductase [Candidatus Saccharibacteria bacterium]